jgi:hypothetical protein
MVETIPDAAVFKSALLLACRAPSVYNSQPWRWVAEGGVLHLFVDPRRIAPRSDPSGREAIISCGAVLGHLRVAMATAGWNANVDRFPNPSNLDHLATIDFSPAEFITSAQCDRADAILRRGTDRLPFAAPTHWDSFEPVLRATLDDSVAILDVISDDKRPRLAEASQLSESFRRDDATYHAELRWWTSPFATSDGVPPSAVVSEEEGPTSRCGSPLPDQGPRRGAPMSNRITQRSLCYPPIEDTRTDALSARALSTVLLEYDGRNGDLHVTHMTEVRASREIVRGLTEKAAIPRVLLRVRTAPELDSFPPATPRRA